jgi:hypothetical protein
VEEEDVTDAALGSGKEEEDAAVEDLDCINDVLDRVSLDMEMNLRWKQKQTYNEAKCHEAKCHEAKCHELNFICCG